MKFKKPTKKNVALNLPRRAQARTGEPEEVLAVSYRLCGDRASTVKIAKQYLTIKATRFDDITLPEGIVFILLEAQQEEFAFQKEYASGRLYRGGAVIDFWLPNQGTVIRVQGDWWHSRPERRELDMIQRGELLMSKIDGKKVENVIDVWERRLLACNRKQVVLAALQGIEMGE